MESNSANIHKRRETININDKKMYSQSKTNFTQKTEQQSPATYVEAERGNFMS
jgi:hypothetical protein